MYMSSRYQIVQARANRTRLHIFQSCRSGKHTSQASRPYRQPCESGHGELSAAGLDVPLMHTSQLLNGQSGPIPNSLLCLQTGHRNRDEIHCGALMAMRYPKRSCLGCHLGPS
jgi:hypothetical protein